MHRGAARDGQVGAASSTSRHALASAGAVGAERRAAASSSADSVGASRASLFEPGRRALRRAGARRAAQRLRGGRRCAVRRRDRHRAGAAPTICASRSCTGCTGSPCGWPRRRRWCSSSTTRTGPTSLRCASCRICRADPRAPGGRARRRAERTSRARAGLLAHLLAGPARRCRELTPLSPAAVADLIRGRVPDADDALCRRCAELTAGNPLGVRELGCGARRR